MKTILCTKWIPDKCVEKFSGVFIFIRPDAEKVFFTEKEIMNNLRTANILFAVSGTLITKEIIDANENLEIIANLGVGYDNVDWQYATKKNIPVINSPTTVTEPTAEHTMALIMSVFHDVVAYTNQIKDGLWMQETFGDRQTGLDGHTLGILGMGRIGKAVARRAIAMGMKVIYFDEYPLSVEEENKLCVKKCTLDELLANSDCLSLHIPFTTKNRHMFNDELFNKMKKGIYFVNVARGGLVDTQALIRALNNGQIKRATLDVFEIEPYINGELCRLNNVIMTPHVASQTKNARINMALECLNGVNAIVKGEKTHNVINPEVLLK